MTLRHAWLLAFALGAAGPAAAQGFGPPQGGAPGAPGAPGAQQVPACAKEFVALKQQADKHGKALQAAGRKASPQQACDLLTKYVEVDAKAVAVAEREGTWCGFPPPAIKSLKDNLDKAQSMKKKVCQVAASGGGAAPGPRGPSFSEALGTTRVPDANTVKSGGSTFNTLSGNALKQ